jgi:hypothetical protein
VQAFLSASDAVVLQEVFDGRISIQQACALNTQYLKFESMKYYVTVTDMRFYDGL